MNSCFILAHMFLGQAYQQKGMMDEAIREFQEAVSLSGRNPVYLGGLGQAYALAAKRREAMGVLEELKKQSRQRYVAARAIAEVYIGLGERDQAFFWLGKAIEERDGWLVHFRGDPRYDPLRSDPRFADLLRRIGSRTASYFIPSAMTGFIVSVFPFRNRVSFKEAFEGLELGEGKLSRPVLRGPGGRKAARLLGSQQIR
jgi:tetratricopeptide (TPR) repeat protein